MRVLLLILALATTTTTSPTQPAAAPLPRATPVTLHLKEAAATDAINKLFEQAGLGVAREEYLESRLRDLKVTIDVEKQPFLVALRELCRQCYLEPDNGQPPGPRIRLQSRRPTTRSSTRSATRPTTRASTTRPSWVDGEFACLRDGFLIVPARATRSSSVSVSALDDPAAQRLQIDFNTMVDPKVTVYAMSSTMELETAEDEAGKSLLRDEPSRSREASYNYDAQRWQWTTTASLAYPSGPAATLKLLRGKIAASIVTRMDAIAIDDIGKDAIGQRKLGDMSFVFSELKESRPGHTRIDVTVTPKNGDRDALRELQQLLGNRAMVHATDASGQPLSVGMSMSTSGGILRGYLEFYRTAPLVHGKREVTRPAKIAWQVPIEVSDVVIPVEFRDLPLP